MNLKKAYIGAVEGLQPIIYNKRIRDLQYAVALHLALMRPRGSVIDGQYVSTQDLRQLKERGEVRLK